MAKSKRVVRNPTTTIQIDTDVGGPSLTKQSFKDECDLNKIMAKYQRTGVMTHVNNFGMKYGEVPALDFRQALHLVIDAQDEFDELPSEVRKRFANDPAEFLAFMEDPNNREEARLLGLLNDSDRLPSEDPPTLPPESSAGPSGDSPSSAEASIE